MEVTRINSFTIFFKLVETQLCAVRSQWFDMIFNLYIWVFCSLVVLGYIMQSFGLAADYGCFQLAGIIGTIGLFEVYGNVMKNIMDFEGDKSISYYLTLPTSPVVVFGSFVAFYALIGTILSFIVFPFGVLILKNSFNLAAVSWSKFIVMTIISNIFFGVFTLLVTAYVGTMAKIRNVWTRFIFPLWYLGGFQFSWEVVRIKSEILSYVMLANPIVFIMEGMRASLLGQASYLSWWLCIGVVSFFTVACWFLMMHKMKKLLDFIV